MAYADVAELARLLKLRTPTAAETDAMQRCLDAAAVEIDQFIGGPAADPSNPMLVTVNLERAREHWNDDQFPFGVIGIGDSTPIISWSNPYNRHKRKLRQAGLKTTEGVA